MLYSCKTEWRFWADFGLFSADFPPKMVPHPCYIYIYIYIYISSISVEFWAEKLRHGTPFFRPHVYMDFSVYVPLIFRLFFRLTFRSFCTDPVFQGCLAGQIANCFSSWGEWLTMLVLLCGSVHAPLLLQLSTRSTINEIMAVHTEMWQLRFLFTNKLLSGGSLRFRQPDHPPW